MAGFFFSCAVQENLLRRKSRDLFPSQGNQLMTFLTSSQLRLCFFQIYFQGDRAYRYVKQPKYDGLQKCKLSSKSVRSGRG